tara:strand:+ start:1021 stop:2904 length:1884 start_codon:yes stop_codon:yes gene_type:complete
LIFNYIGNYSLIISVIISLTIFFLSISNLQKINIKKKINLNKLNFFQFFFVLVSFFSLVVLFVLSEFSNITVFNNSHTTKPLFYKISGTWGNHEGSLLLWLLILTLSLFIYFLSSKSRPIKERLLTLIFQEVIIIGFLIFIIKTSNPFNQIFPIPKEGLGLNPILQDPILAIHPPVLYLGYVSTSIIFSSSLASLVQGNVNNLWAKHIKKWIFASWIFLTIGILLGSIWAYYELGWGGFWFWDPVENISLMPWLSLTALLHCILVLEKRSLLSSWTIILSISTFTLSVCGTFLVRSGILNSVHTFANDPERGLFILIFLFILVFLSLVIYFLFEKNLKTNNNKFNLLTKESSILINNWFIMYFLSVILIGTIYPIFLEVLSDQKISVGPPFFNKLLIPFLIPFLIFMSIGPNLNWIKNKIFENKIQLIIFFILNLILSFFIIKIFGRITLTFTILLAASFYLFYITFKDLIKKDYKNISQAISHFGFSLLILSILMNSILSKEIIANLKVGEEIKFMESTIKFKKVENSSRSNFKSLVGFFEINNKDDKKFLFKPEIRIYNQPQVITSEADIKTNFFKDKFFVINLVKGENYFNIRYQEKPLMIWIWLSTILIAIGGSVSFFKRYEK